MDKIESYYLHIVQSFLMNYGAMPIANGSIATLFLIRNKTITR
jgi:hypothetical protein